MLIYVLIFVSFIITSIGKCAKKKTVVKKEVLLESKKEKEIGKVPPPPPPVPPPPVLVHTPDEPVVQPRKPKTEKKSVKRKSSEKLADRTKLAVILPPSEKEAGLPNGIVLPEVPRNIQTEEDAEKAKKEEEERLKAEEARKQAENEEKEQKEKEKEQDKSGKENVKKDNSNKEKSENVSKNIDVPKEDVTKYEVEENKDENDGEIR